MRKATTKLNNAGAALVTVIVVIAFISVMVTVLLYTSSINFYMKTTDMKIKGSFYDAETVLEEVRAALVVRASDAYKAACLETQKSYASSGDGDTRADVFRGAFTSAFKSKWDTDAASYVSSLEFLRTMVDYGYRDDLIWLTGGGTPTLEVSATGDCVYLRGVKVRHTSDDGYVSIIETDFVIRPPEVSWEVDTSATEWAGESEALERKEIDMVDCVNYLNWIKE